MKTYSGCGNTFSLIDNREGTFSKSIKEVCNKNDGVILLENSNKADVKMRIFNRDGNETEMCGNGVRCLIRFLEDLKDPRKSFTVETMERILLAKNLGEMISVEMGLPTCIHWDQMISVDNKSYLYHHLNTGVPHFVTFTNFVPRIAVNELGAKIRFHPKFSPKGVNVNFAQIEEDETITLRTYERGVEAETNACGTGATATALAAHKVYGLKSPIVVRTKSQELLYISFNYKDNNFDDLTLTGPATLV